MKTSETPIQLKGRSPIEFVEDKLFSPRLIRNFLSCSFEGKINLVEGFIIGPETERFAAEPVYSVTGQGKLTSQGVDGIKAKIELQEYLNSYEGLSAVIPFIQKIEELAEKKLLKHA